MDNDQKIEQLLEALVHVIGRSAVPLEEVQKAVATSAKHVKAFNLCDGIRAQKQVVKACRMNQSSLSKTFARWVENGVAFWIGESKADRRLLHIYPIPASSAKAKKKKRARGKK